MSFSPRRRVQLLSLALGVSVALAMAPTAAQASIKDPTTKSVLKATQKAMSTVTGVHIYVLSKTGKDSSVVIVDIGATYGQETIVSGKEHVKITVTPTDAYLSGSPTGLTTIMQPPAARCVSRRAGEGRKWSGGGGGCPTTKKNHPAERNPPPPQAGPGHEERL